MANGTTEQIRAAVSAKAQNSPITVIVTTLMLSLGGAGGIGVYAQTDARALKAKVQANSDELLRREASVDKIEDIDEAVIGLVLEIGHVKEDVGDLKDGQKEILKLIRQIAK